MCFYWFPGITALVIWAFRGLAIKPFCLSTWLRCDFEPRLWRPRRRCEPCRRALLLLLLHRKGVSARTAGWAARMGRSGRPTSPGGRRRGCCGAFSKATMPAAPPPPSSPSSTPPPSAIRGPPSPWSARPSSVHVFISSFPCLSVLIWFLGTVL